MEDNKRTNANAQYYNTQNAKSARHDSAHTPNNAFPKYINIYIYTVPTEPRTSFLFFYALLLLLLISSFILLCLLFRRLFVAHLCAPRLYDQKKKNKKNEHLWSDRNTNWRDSVCSDRVPAHDWTKTVNAVHFSCKRFDGFSYSLSLVEFGFGHESVCLCVCMCATPKTSFHLRYTQQVSHEVNPSLRASALACVSGMMCVCLSFVWLKTENQPQS